MYLCSPSCVAGSFLSWHELRSVLYVGYCTLRFLSSLFCSYSLYPVLCRSALICLCFVTPKTSFLKLWSWICFQVTTVELCIAMESSTKCVPRLLPSHASIHLHGLLRPHLAGSPLSCRAAFPALQRCGGVILPTRMACYRYLCKARLVPRNDKHEGSRLPVDARSTREVAGTVKPSKSYGQVKENLDVAMRPHELSRKCTACCWQHLTGLHKGGNKLSHLCT